MLGCNKAEKPRLNIYSVLNINGSAIKDIKY